MERKEREREARALTCIQHSQVNPQSSGSLHSAPYQTHAAAAGADLTTDKQGGLLRHRHSSISTAG